MRSPLELSWTPPEKGKFATIVLQQLKLDGSSAIGEGEWIVGTLRNPFDYSSPCVHMYISIADKLIS